MTTLVAPKLFRTGGVAAILHPDGPDDHEDAEVASTIISPEELQAFAGAIRDKEEWYAKILDQKDLAKKWAEEAQLHDHPDLDALIRSDSSTVLKAPGVTNIS
jgi:hypothetical protein